MVRALQRRKDCHGQIGKTLDADKIITPRPAGRAMLGGSLSSDAMLDKVVYIFYRLWEAVSGNLPTSLHSGLPWSSAFVG